MKKVLFDGIAMQADSRAKFHGGGEYTKYILKEAIKCNFQFDIVINPSLYLDEDIRILLEKHSRKIIHVANKQELYSIINKLEYEIFYSPLPYSYNDYSGNATLIGVIHGLRPIEIVWDEYKHKYYNSTFLKFISWIISKNRLIQSVIKNKRIAAFHKLIMIPNSQFITVSNHTKYSLITFFPKLLPENIKVFYSPFDIPKIEKENQNRNNNNKFFLLVSGNRFEKNSYRAILAFDKLFTNKTLSDEFDVVITGADQLPFKNEIRNRERFKLLPYVDAHELNELYHDAFCYIYPSLNEGFGYPPLIAMSQNTPVIASASTSIPEVCGNAALYFTPGSIDELCNRILNIVNDDKLRTYLCENGIKRVLELQKRQKDEMSDYMRLIFNN